jgi:hypothetical protein
MREQKRRPHRLRETIPNFPPQQSQALCRIGFSSAEGFRYLRRRFAICAVPRRPSEHDIRNGR